MKKLLTIVALGIVITSTLASCTACYDCEIEKFGVISVEEVCNATKQDIEDISASGWMCTKK